MRPASSVHPAIIGLVLSAVLGWRLNVTLAHPASGDELRTRNGAVVVEPLAHAGVRLTYSGSVLYVDPWSKVGLAPDAAPANLILVTDADAGAHHLDTTAISQLRRQDTAVVTPASGRGKTPGAIVMANGERRTFGPFGIEAVAAYDLRPGEPFHAKGVANGYVVTVDGMRVLFAGVTECVPEIGALPRIDVAFVPMNLPNGRMTIDATASCLASMAPRIAYPYHYDQDYIARLAGRGRPSGAEDAARSVRELTARLAGRVEVRAADWYPTR